MGFGNRPSAIDNHQSSISGHAHSENRKVRAVEPAQIATRASLFLRQARRMVPMTVKPLRKSQDFRWAEFDAEPAAFATVPIYEDLTAELSGFYGSNRHSNLDGRAAFPEPAGANCPIWTPLEHTEHSIVHIDRLVSRKCCFSHHRHNVHN